MRTKETGVKALGDTKYGYLLCAPMIIYIVVVMLFPLVWGFSLSFTDKSIGGVAEFIGLDNYKFLLTDPQFGKSFGVTIAYTIISVFFKMLFGLFMALVLNNQFKGRNLARAALIIPWTLPNVVAVLNWRWIFSDIGGVANYLLKTVGLIEKDLVWLGDAKLAFLAILIVNIWRGIPFFGIQILSKLQTIPNDLYEAAVIDGCGVFRQLFSVTIPYIKPTIISTLLLRTMWIVNFPDIIYAMTNGGPVNSTNILATQMINTVFKEYDYGKGSAIGVIIMVILFVYSVIYLKLTKSAGDDV